MYNRELIDIQRNLEEEMRGAAITRFHDRHDKAMEKKFFELLKHGFYRKCNK